MSLPTSYVYGSFADSQGNPLAYKTVSFVPVSTPYATGNTVISSTPITVTLDGAGAFTGLQLISGCYRIVVTNDNVVSIRVPGDGSNNPLVSLLVNLSQSVGYTRITSPQELYGAMKDSATIKLSLSGDKSAAPIQVAFVGETGNLPLTSGVPDPFIAALLQEHVAKLCVLGNGYSGPLSDSTAFTQWTDLVGSYGGDFCYALGPSDWSSLSTANATVSFLSSYASSHTSARYYKAIFTDYGSLDIGVYVLDSNASEPDGTSSASIQAEWLQQQLAVATERWSIVVFTDAIYSSVDSSAGRTLATAMRWPFKSWGADAVITAGAGMYEHLIVDGLHVIVTGGGKPSADAISSTPDSHSITRYNATRTFVWLNATEAELKFTVVSIDGRVKDVVTIDAAEDRKLDMNLSIGKWSGLVAGLSGVAVSPVSSAYLRYVLGDATRTFDTLQGVGAVIRVASLPSVSAVRANPFWRNSIFILGDDPGRAYIWNRAGSYFTKLYTDAAMTSSDFSGSITQLVPPTLEIHPAVGSGLIAGAVISHTNAAAVIWVSLNGEAFTVFDWNTNPNYLLPAYNPDQPNMIAAFASLTGWADSELAMVLDND